MAQCPYSYFVYEIQTGETIQSVSERFAVSEQVIRQRNGPAENMPGVKLKIPCASGGCDHGEFYTIRRGETLLRIARRHKLSLADLLAANPFVNPNHVVSGQVIVIPASRQVFSAEVYTLADDEGLFDVLRKFSMDVTGFCALNPGRNPMDLKAGQSVNVKRHREREGRWYTLGPEETLMSVAERHSLPVSMLLSANEHLRPSDFVPGMPVRIPD